MIVIDYKILFGVRILHDYYLFGPDSLEKNVSKSYFAMNEAAQKSRLHDLLRRERYGIGKDLNFLLSTTDRRTFSDLRLRMIRIPTGFLIGIEVEETVQNGGTVRFRPAISPSDDATLTFGIEFANPSFAAISNLRLDRDTDRIYYFTNKGNHDGMSLSKPIGRLTAGQQYRMGDLAFVGRDLRQAIEDNSGDAGFWRPVAGNALVNQADRSLSVDEKCGYWLASLGSSRRPKVVIQIALKSGNGSLSPLDADGLLTTRFVSGRARPAPPVFELRFLSRSTYWRYRKVGGFSDGQIKTIEKHANKVVERSGEDFVTKAPWPVARELPPLPLEEPPDEFFRLPNAQPGFIRAVGGKLYSEIYLHHVP